MNSKNYNIVDGFNTIAPAYDMANDAMTLGLHRLWRRALCKKALKFSPKNSQILDVATGTGDVIIGLFSDRSDIHVTGIDASEGMLNIAREKFKSKANLFQKNIELLLANGLSLPFLDNSFHTVTVCWGIRNIRPYSAALREIKRVLKPGGSVIILESGRPEFKIVRSLYNSYSKLLPFIGEKISKYKPAYQFYKASVDAFPSGKQFVAELYDAGFFNAKYETLGASIVYLYSAQKPAVK
ncbi:ubiquinone/menaquinone biosynthesis methyltransferase [Fluviispira multicolorata]|uniref:Demethylmenaquinone methyltransferase n=1 Tax=Fluviispira multicolorata TaxID=2654512 RepID=A0A833JEG3_9BACT|nr:ubiquinone/menaquinone biosynthesis methyltransferase [Fluviispira multicolorata]KAB8029839.1 ubiquinone/menaquinone biosynthesis methyltransferase [Fluviispira multicolorata]